MIISNILEMKINGKNIDWYRSKGYDVKLKDVILVPVEDLSVGTRITLTIKCDYCGEVFERTNKDYRKQSEKCVVKKDACSNCRVNKMEEANLIKYGVTNVMHLKEVKDAVKKSNFKKYGVEFITQSKEYKEKVKKQSMLKYGVNSFFMTDEFKEKAKITNIKKYGVPYSLANPDIKKKAMITLSAKNNAPTSKQQSKIHTIVGGELNKVVSNSWLDIAFNELMIYLEYDGGGHNLGVKLGRVTEEEFLKKEKRRYFFLKGLGWKEIRIISETDKLKDDDLILKFVENAKLFLKNNNTFSIRWNMDIDKVSIGYKEYISFKNFINLTSEEEYFEFINRTSN